MGVPAIKDIAKYEAMKISKTPMMVGYYTGHFSAASKMFQQQFESMAAAYPKYSFYTCDVDDVPLAAYDAEVEDVPSVVILPLGLKPDGSHYDKTGIVVIAPELAAFHEVIPLMSLPLMPLLSWKMKESELHGNSIQILEPRCRRTNENCT